MLVIKEVHCVHQDDTDVNQGQPEWAFSDADIAKMIAKGCGWYGGDAPISIRQAVVDDETGVCYIILKTVKINEAMGSKQEAIIDLLKKRALAKLTIEELKLLGL